MIYPYRSGGDPALASPPMMVQDRGVASFEYKVAQALAAITPAVSEEVTA